MGQHVTANSKPTFRIYVKGTAPIEYARVIRNGQPIAELTKDHRSTSGTKGKASTLEKKWEPKEEAPESSYYYVHVRQVDGNEAWASPLWIE
jgi:hypothetical protein